MCLRDHLVSAVEQGIVRLLEDFVKNKNAKFRVVNTCSWYNCEQADDGTLRLRYDDGSLSLRLIAFNHSRSRHRFTLILNVLAEIHRLLIIGGTCTPRQLYYKNTLLTRKQTFINWAIHDVCSILRTSPWQLGILSSGKGLIAGALQIFMTNGDIIDCRSYEGATLLPQNFTMIEHLETSAAFVLLVEKDTVFKKLVSENILSMLGVEIILITGKGFPDLSTRFIVHRLYSECCLPIYTLVDADPFGLEIMLVYRHGSRTMANHSDTLACPKIHWIGIHPSEITMIFVHTVPLNQSDRKKIAELLEREYIGEAVRKELRVLERIQRKAEIEGVSGFSLSFLINDYIPNKIKRNLLI